MTGKARYVRRLFIRDCLWLSLLWAFVMMRATSPWHAFGWFVLIIAFRYATRWEVLPGKPSIY